ncbi:hypothetical protein AAK899_05615 [Erysipelotrichaceae bacterium 51-3]
MADFEKASNACENLPLCSNHSLDNKKDPAKNKSQKLETKPMNFSTQFKNCAPNITRPSQPMPYSNWRLFIFTGLFVIFFELFQPWFCKKQNCYLHLPESDF